VIWLARHGETAANAEGRVQGWLDPPLNERGRAQARALAREAKALDLRALYSSQLVRARETAGAVGEHVGLEAVVDDRLAESNRGEWEGRLLRDIEREDADNWHAWQRGDENFRFPGGESIREHVDRVAEALGDVAAGELPALVVCHGGSIRCALIAHGERRIEEFARIAVPNAALVPLEVGSK
jgi:broad specificity phosphatase PhoE